MTKYINRSINIYGGIKSMRFKDYLNESAAAGGNINKYLRNIKKKSPREAEKILKNDWKSLSNLLKRHALEKDAIAIINKHFGTNYRNLNQIDKADIAKIPTKHVYEDSLLNEDFKNFWELVKSEGFPVLSFYPCLQAWLEIDKLLRGTGGDYKVMGVYGLMWALLVSGKFIKGWQKWKKENPKEFEAEGARKNPFAISSKKRGSINKVYNKEW
jgi:hypothetical protein